MLVSEIGQRCQTRLKNALDYKDEDRCSAEEAFLVSHPNFLSVDSLRASEYARIDQFKHVYLDYTGGGLYAQAQLDAHMEQLRSGVFGNPHSVNPTSLAATQLVEQARTYVHEFFRADPDDYAVIFTSNASGALKLVGESYPFEAQGQYLLTFDNHNSVNGIREYARHHGARVTYVPLLLPDLRIDEVALQRYLDEPLVGGNNLFAYPAQSNFSGVQHSLHWVEEAHARGWDVLLDCAAYVPTNRLDLTQVKPDFIPLSFYKMFGYPTGIGVLFVRREKLAKLRRPWFAGGTVAMVSTLIPSFFRAENEAAFEDGTVNYLDIPAVEIGLKHLEKVGVDSIHQRVLALTDYLLKEMMAITHNNDHPLVAVYGPCDISARGGTIAFNLLDPNGQMYDVRLIEALASQARISLRTGCFCNPGAGENAFHLTAEDVLTCSSAASPVTYENYMAALTARMGSLVTGAIRISLGIASNFADVYHFVQFLKMFKDFESPGVLER